MGEGKVNPGLSSATTSYQSFLVCGCFLNMQNEEEQTGSYAKHFEVHGPNRPWITSSFHAVSAGSAGSEKEL